MLKKAVEGGLLGGWNRFTVWVDSESDAREAMAKLAAESSWPMRSLFRHVATLEDVFVELTRRD